MIVFALPYILSVFALVSVAAPGATNLIVILHHVQSQRTGEITCAIFAAEDGFPMHSEKAVATVKAVGPGSDRQCVFHAPTEGDYAVSVVHDEDGNGKLNTNLFGAPTEGWATSGNVTHALRAPDFKESKFHFSTSNSKVELEMHY